MNGRILSKVVGVPFVAAILLSAGFVGVAETAHAVNPTLTYVVNSTGDQPDAQQNNGVCATSLGTCTLRAALMEGKVHHNTNIVVNFDLPGPGPFVIQLNTFLPSLDQLTTPITVDGYSQAGASPNTDPLISNAVIKIEIRGLGDSSNVVSWWVTSPNNVIRGLAMNRAFKQIGISGPDAHDNQIAGMFIGTNPAGTYGAATRVTYANGVELMKGANHNTIGGHTAADRNIVSGNAGHGIATYNADTNYNTISDNIVALNPSGTNKLPNRVEGIDINRDSSYNIIGGFGPFDHNVSSGNDTGGIEISHNLGTDFNQVLGNYVGTKPDGKSKASYTANGAHGINIEDGSSYNVIQGNIVGGNPRGIEVQAYGVGREAIGNQFIGNWVGIAPTGENISNGGYGIHITDRSINNIFLGNEIANNSAQGIAFESGFGTAIGNTFSRNSIHDNSGIGIDLSPLGSSANNDAGDADVGPNTLLNYPVFGRVDAGVINGTVCAKCTVELFKATNTGNGHGQGKTYIGSAVADVAGSWTFDSTGLVSVGNVINSTATDSKGDTSEYSFIATVGPANIPPNAVFTSSCVVAACHFNANGSNDPDGSVVSYAWTFGDGGTATGPVVDHTYAASGTDTVTLTVTDNKSGVGTVQHDVNPLLANVLPSANFTSTCTLNSCTLDGSTSTDSDGTITDYAWDFGDGTFANGPSATVPHNYAGPADYPATLTVTDNRSGTAFVAHTVSVQAENQAPSAAFTSSCTTEGICAFDPGSSNDPDGSIVSYSWDFGDSVTSTETAPAHTYSLSGDYFVTLTVTDDRGGSGSTSQWVTATVPNHAPTAAFTMTCTGQVCSADAFGSADSDGLIASYDWAFSDGTYDTGSSVNHTFPTYGPVNVTLTVTDDKGAPGWISQGYVLEPSFNVPLASDSFTRTSASGWGTSDLGGAYTYPAGHAPSFSVDGSTGHLVLPTAGTSRQGWLAGASALDVDASVTVSLPTVPTGSTYGVTSIIQLRRVAQNLEYRARIRIAPNGQVFVAATKAVGSNTDVLIGAEQLVSGITYTPGLKVRVRAEVFGTNPTTFRMKVWPAGTAESSLWTLTRTDSEAALQAAGGVGLYGYVSTSVTNAPVDLSFDDFDVKRQGA